MRGKTEFAAAILDPEHELFVVHVSALSVNLGDEVHPLKKAQIAYLKIDEAIINILSKYTDFAVVISPKLAAKLSKHMGINDYAIELVDDRQPVYGPIYNLSPMELEMLKAYIENNLANGFVRPSNSPAKAPILFDKKLDNSLRLYVDYRDFNNLTIKNRYLLPFIRKLFD